MAGQIERIGVFTITNGTTSVEIVPQMFPASAPAGKLRLTLGFATEMTIASPATLPETVHLEAIMYDNDTTWYVVPVITFVAGQTTSFIPPAAARLRLVAGGAVGADRVFVVNCRYDMNT